MRKKINIRTSAHCALLVCGLNIFGCSTQKVTREQIEWSRFRWEQESAMDKPRILFIGNSISVGYFPEVSGQLKEVANCDHYATSRSVEDPAFYKETKMAMGKYNHQIIHFNNGLHGWHLNSQQYEKGLRKYVRFLIKHKSKNCQLVYSLTTPYPSKEPGIKLDEKMNPVVIERNRIAREIMQENGIEVIDLYSLVEPELEKLNISKGNVHYNKDGYELMAKKISGKILKLINKEENKLTQSEINQGWKLLFDGETFNGWRCVGSETVQTDHTDDARFRNIKIRRL